MNPIDVMGDVLLFKGFMKTSFKDKLKWLFVLYPFFLLVLVFHLILWIPLLPKIIFKRR